MGGGGQPSTDGRSVTVHVVFPVPILSSVLTFSGPDGAITVLVENSVINSPNKTFGTHVVYRGILLGGLKRLQDSNTGFT